jgi:hypothetical protein
MTEQERYRGAAEAAAVAAASDPFGANPQIERERLKFNDNVAQGELFKPWTPFKHPQFGDIEIGGWVKMSSRLPHPFMLADLVHRNASAVMFAASQTPRVSMEVFGVEKIGNGLHRVRVRLANSGSIPSMSHHSVQKKIAPRDVLQVSGKAGCGCRRRPPPGRAPR